MLLSPTSDNETLESNRKRCREEDHDHDEEGDEIAIASDGKSVTSFLSKHIPQTYNPLADRPTSPMASAPSADTKFCNRHRPDRKCRRQADEVSMEELQKVRTFVCPCLSGTTASLTNPKQLGTLSQSDQQGISHVWSVFSAAPAKQRELMLQGILSVCCFPQLSFISAAVRDLIKIDFLALLPPELSFKILCSLDTTSLTKAARVSRRWRQLADDDVVWHKMCEQHIDRKCTKCGWGLPLLERKRLRLEKRQIQLRASGRGLNEWSPDITPFPETPPADPESNIELTRASASKRGLDNDTSSPEVASKRLCSRPSAEEQTAPAKRPWKEVYKARFRVGTNWKYRRFSPRDPLVGHTNGVTCLQFRDNILATGSYDSTVKIWDIESGEVIRTLTGHTLGVRCLQFDDHQLASGSLDGTVKIWDWRTGQLIKNLRGPTKGVISVHFDGHYLCAGSMDTYLYVWNNITKRSTRFSGHTDFVNSVKVDCASRTVLSASDDCTVRLWDLDTGETLRVFDGHVGPVQQVVALPHEFEMDESDLADNPLDEQDTDTDQDFDDIEEGGNSHRDSRSIAPRGTRCNRVVATPPPSLVNTPIFPEDPSRPNPAQYILTGALDSTLRLWHVPTGRCLRTMFGHVEGIWALAADSLRAVSGAEDRMVKVWDIRTGKCENTYTGHTGPVTCIGLSSDTLITGSEDQEVRVMCFAETRPMTG
jgi:F-box/WD-40 domain protein MET30